MQEYTAGISLTEMCDMKCKHCYIGRKNFWKKNHYKPKSISLDKFNQLLPQLKEANVTRINFGGGESTLHPNFIEICQKLYDSGIKTSLVTNGSKTSLIMPYLHLFNDIGVSIDFPDERHSENRGSPKSFQNAVSCLKEISGKVKTEMVTCIMNTNYQDLPKLYALAQECNVDMWRLNRFHATKNDLVRFSGNVSGMDEIIDISYLACSQRQMKEAFEYLSSLIPANHTFVTPDPVFRTLINGNGVVAGVPYGQTSFRIKSDGGVVTNLFIDNPIGNVFQKPLKEILTNKNEVNLEGKCTSCVNSSHCNGGDLTDKYLTDSLQDPYCYLDNNVKKDVKIIPLSSINFVHESYLGTIYVPVRWK